MSAARDSTVAEADNVASPRVQHLEATNLTTAKVLAFAELPTIAELEEKATAIRDVVEKRRERDREESAVQALTQEATGARNVANRLGTELAELQKLVELTKPLRCVSPRSPRWPSPCRSSSRRSLSQTNSR